MRAWIDELAQLVTDSAAQHEQYAAALEQHATAWQAQQQQLSTQVELLTEQYAHITKDYKTLAELVDAGKNRIAAAHRADAGLERPWPLMLHTFNRPTATCCGSSWKRAKQ